jgi:hypothetical protein
MDARKSALTLLRRLAVRQGTVCGGAPSQSAFARVRRAFAYSQCVTMSFATQLNVNL